MPVNGAPGVPLPVCGGPEEAGGVPESPAGPVVGPVAGPDVAGADGAEIEGAAPVIGGLPAGGAAPEGSPPDSGGAPCGAPAREAPGLTPNDCKLGACDSQLRIDAAACA